MSAKVKKLLKNKKAISFRRFLVPLTTLVLVSLSWLVYRSILRPIGVNEVATAKRIDGNGCYYQKVQCVQEPCEPIKVCPTLETQQKICTQEAGTCIGNDGGCVTYTDGCLKSRLCSNDQSNIAMCRDVKITPVPTIPSSCISWFDGCNTCRVSNGKISGCTMMACMGNQAPAKCLEYTNEVVETVENPPQTSTPPVGCIKWFDGCNTCGVIDGKIAGCTKMACERSKVGPDKPNTPKCIAYENTSPNPATTQPQSVLSTFYASSPCGESHYTSYTYTCNNGQKYSDNSLCISISSAMSSARAKCQAGI